MDRLASAWQRRTLQAAAVLAVAVLAAMAWVQAQYWRDSVSLYQRSQQATGGRSQVHVNLGAALREQGRVAEAISVYQRGLELYPELALLHMNFGNALRDQKRFGDAVERYREALRLEPDSALVYANLAIALASLRELEAAAAAAREAVRLGPELALAQEVLAEVLRAQGRSGAVQPSAIASPSESPQNLDEAPLPGK